MNFKKINNLTGWVVFLIALVTYTLTIEARGSLWDCGEFVACAYKVQLPHPPGAPVFVLLGRFFIILFGDNPMTAGHAINFMSGLASAATILFLFWTITYFVARLLKSSGGVSDNNATLTTMIAGVIGALSYTFSDSFWYSAVEGEVYALSSFFTALVFWAIIKWDKAAEEAGNDPVLKIQSDRWIVFLFFMVGLSIGVHLLNLLTIPCIVMVYYYRRFTPTVKGAIWAFVIGCVLTVLTQVIIIQYSMKAAGIFDVFFVNSFGMPFFSGFAVYFILIAALVIWGFTFTAKTSSTKVATLFALLLALSTLPLFATDASSGIGNFFKLILIVGAGVVAGYLFKPSTGIKPLKLALWCYSFVMLGYFTYFTAMIRSNANPSVDMNNVDNPISLVNYLSREQYGSAPLLYGPHFMAEVARDASGNADIKFGETKYIKADGRYIPVGKDMEYRYESSDYQLFPRIWSSSNEQYHVTFYGDWLGLEQDQQTGKYEAPTFADNINWYMTYQNGWMYWRYFMWNFSGRQNDIQGMGNVRDGNWISGISVMDNARLGNQEMLPDSIKNNKGRNKLFMLPFALGILGFIYQFFKNRHDWIITTLFFLLTGLAIMFYLNTPGNQPRERDYVFVGAFYVFALWMGIGVAAVVKLAKEKLNSKLLINTLFYGAVTAFIVTLMSSLNGSFSGAFVASIVAAIIFAAFTAIVVLVTRAASGNGQNVKMATLLAGILCLGVPLLMAQQEWDDHDRSQKTLAPDLARDYMEACAPNAILFSFGDNDTYPLWYLQEVEGVRPDIRLINTSLLGIDWYINQLRYKVNESDPVDVIWTPEQIEGENRNYMFYRPDNNVNQSVYYDLYDVMKNVLGKRVENPETGRDLGDRTFSVSKFSVPVNVEEARANGSLLPTDTMVSNQIQFEIPASKLERSPLTKSDFIILNVIAANHWKRPIYFTSLYGSLGFAQYLRKEGLSYRLVPTMVKNTPAKWEVNDAMMKVGLGSSDVWDNNLKATTALLDKVGNNFGGADKKGTYFDEENRRHLSDIRAMYAETAGQLADEGKKEEGLKYLDKVINGVKEENLPYAMVSRFGRHNSTALLFLEACYKTGKLDMAQKVKAALKKDMEQQKKYYEYLLSEKTASESGKLSMEYRFNDALTQVLNAIEAKYEAKAATPANNTTESSTTVITNAADSSK